MHRSRCSRPIAIAMADGIIREGTTVFDYGCGRGGDVTYLKKRGAEAHGWDPHYSPKATLKKSAIVARAS